MGFEESKKRSCEGSKSVFSNGIISSTGPEAAVILGCELWAVLEYGNTARRDSQQIFTTVQLN